MLYNYGNQITITTTTTPMIILVIMIMIVIIKVFSSSLLSVVKRKEFFVINITNHKDRIENLSIVVVKWS